LARKDQKKEIKTKIWTVSPELTKRGARGGFPRGAACPWKWQIQKQERTAR